MFRGRRWSAIVNVSFKLRAEELLSCHHGFHRNPKLPYRVRLQHVPVCANAHGSLYDRAAVHLGQKQYLRPWANTDDVVSNFNSVDAGKSDIQQYQVRLQFNRFAHCLQAVGSFTDHLQLRIFLEQRSDGTMPWHEIFDEQNPCDRQFS